MYHVEMSIRIVTIALIALLLSGPAGDSRAGMYSYTDENGTVHITDQPPRKGGKLLLTTLKRPKGYKDPVVTGKKYGKMVGGQALAYGLPRPLLLAIIKTESNFNPKAVSPKGATGLMQLMPGTWKDLGVTDPFDPEQNVRAGSAYFRDMLARFKNVNLALAAYNAGPGNVEKYNGIPPFDETQRYIKKVQWYYQYYKDKGNLVDLPGVSDTFENGYQALQGGKTQKAISDFSRVVRTFPNSPEANYNLAMAYERQGRLAQAINFYIKTIKLNPYFKEAYYNLAIIYERIGQNAKAVQTWTRYLDYEVKTEDRREVTQYIGELRRLMAQK
jgi:hypothetical protein